MGLFDTIQFDFQVPGRGVLHTWQTKSFSNALDNYIVTGYPEYKIYREEWDYEWVENDTCVLKGYFQAKPDTYRRVHLTDFHGDVIFYDKCSSCDYTARFSYGKLENITFKTRWRLNDEEVLHECPAVREQGACPRGKEWEERCREVGVPAHLVYQVEKRK
jgi:hypothetical protein